mgnify:CR=1 FL=1
MKILGISSGVNFSNKDIYPASFQNKTLEIKDIKKIDKCPNNIRLLGDTLVIDTDTNIAAISGFNTGTTTLTKIFLEDTDVPIQIHGNPAEIAQALYTKA